ncbi:MAG: hypothetical protein ABI904_10030 [Chloroflexota bacterium]
MKEKISKITLNDKAVPVILLVAVFLSFGLLIPWLGFYWDDWPVVYLTKTQGIKGFWDFYQYDRPFSAWTYIVLTPLLGVNPILWKLFVLGLRWLASVVLWLCLKTIWPAKRDQALWTALLFAVCPVFYQQQVAIAYSQHWICYLFYFLSIYLMLKAIGSGKYRVPLTMLAVSLSLIQMFTMEYFLGLELLRPVVLWIYQREHNPQASQRDTFRTVLRSSLIYILALCVFVFWRLFILEFPKGSANDPIVLAEFLHAPVQAVVSLAERILQDVFYILASWVVSVNPLNFSLSRPFSLVTLAAAILGGAGIGVLLHRFAETDIPKNERRNSYPMAFGFLALVLGVLPVWAIGRQVTLGGDRFIFSAMFGLCLILVSGLDWFSSQRSSKIILISVLVALAVHTNLFTAKAYQQSWEKQRDFYWQLFWRAPDIEPNTAFISNGEIFPFVGGYPTSMGISVLYPPVEHPQQMPYWFFNYQEGVYKKGDLLLQGTPLRDAIRNYKFQGNSTDALLIEYAPENGHCLQIFSAADERVKEIPAEFRKLLPMSNLARIQRSPQTAGWTPPMGIFGSEPKHDWCFYYQEADLARQFGDWKEVSLLFKNAQALGLAPVNEIEYLLFIDSFIKQNQFDKAFDLTLKVKQISKRNNDSLCGLWSGYTNLSAVPEFVIYHGRVINELGCVP